jgi:heme/copper-type cytochrome/quinol oxidase subunit 2
MGILTTLTVMLLIIVVGSLVLGLSAYLLARRRRARGQSK